MVIFQVYITLNSMHGVSNIHQLPFFIMYFVLCVLLLSTPTPKIYARTHLPRYLVGRQLVNYMSQRVGEEEVMDDTNETEVM